MAATIALVQVDIKRVLAWSTVSQIGYMIMAAGLGLYGPSMFHFLTHAFFKALLFLAVGIAIHALAGEQSLDRMGGLRRHLPVTNVAVLVGCLAISGIPPFSGFFSKDEILATAMDAGDLGVILGIVGIAARRHDGLLHVPPLLPAPSGAPSPRAATRRRPHEGGWAMAAPVSVLALGATFIGFLQVPGGWHLINDWLEPALIADPGIEATRPPRSGSSASSASVLALVRDRARLVGLRGRPGPAHPPACRRPPPAQLLADQYRFDEVYEEAVVQPGRDLGDVLTTRVERVGVQGSIEGVGARRCVDAGRGLRTAAERPRARLRLRDDRRRRDRRRSSSALAMR